MVVATAMAVITAGPAGAVDTETTFTVEAGDLEIAAEPLADLGDGAPGTDITASLGPVVVTDQRAELTPTWVASVDSEDFVTGGASASETIADDLVEYWSGPVTASTGSGVTLVPGQANAGAAQNLSVQRQAFELTAGVGNNSATWSPTLIVNVPASAVGGDYTGTVTHSVL